MTTEKTHFRKAFDSPYLGSADLVEPTILTISHVRLEPDHTKKTKDVFNTAFFVEQELRRGEKLKPMILNASNSKTMRTLAGSPYIDDCGRGLAYQPARTRKGPPRADASKRKAVGSGEGSVPA